MSKPVNLGLDRATSELLDQACGGLKVKREVANRVLTWFCQQDKTIQNLIVDDFDPADVERIAKVVLERMARAGPAGQPGRGAAGEADAA